MSEEWLPRREGGTVWGSLEDCLVLRLRSLSVFLSTQLMVGWGGGFTTVASLETFHENRRGSMEEVVRV
jgi:hypothetical protein